MMKLQMCWVLGLLFSIVCSAAIAAEEAVPVFEGGKGGYAIYRIPSIILSKKGTLLAAAEGRVNASDHAQNNIVIRRSSDNGKTWGDNIIVAKDGKLCFNNPCMVVLGSGRILMIIQRYPEVGGEYKVKDGVTGETCLCFATYSDDDGLTWSALEDITAQVKRPTGITSIASGPGIGIVLKNPKFKDRIIIPFNQGPGGKWEVYAAYSDDNGKTWKYGEVAPNGKAHRPNEVQMVELSDGRILLNARGMAGNKYRKVAVSEDGGITWSDVNDQTELTESRCMGSIISYDAKDGKAPKLLYVGPASQKARSEGTLWISTDDGKTWPTQKLLVPGEFAYSVVVALPDGNLGLIYETNKYKRINFLFVSKESVFP